MVNCLLEGPPTPTFFSRRTESCCVCVRAGLVASGGERPEARLGCFNCPREWLQ